MQDKSVKGLFSTKSQVFHFHNAFLCWSPQRKINGKSWKNYANNYKPTLRRLAKSMTLAHLFWLRISVFRGPNQMHDQRKAVLCLFSGDIGLFFPPRKGGETPLVYNLKARLFIYLQCKGTVQGPTLTAVSGVASAPQDNNGQLLSLLLGNLLY